MEKIFEKPGFLKRRKAALKRFVGIGEHLEEVQPGSFIYFKAKALPINICSDIISRFEGDSRTTVSKVYPDILDPSIRTATEINIYDLPGWEDIAAAFMKSLDEVLSDLSRSLRILAEPRIQFLGDTLTVQRTKPGEFYQWHYDYIHNSQYPRQISLVWYLNDVEEGGETEFDYQRVKVKPAAGSIIVFPSSWTHVHRGVPPVSGVKYITTAWMSCRHLDY